MYEALDDDHEEHRPASREERAERVRQLRSLGLGLLLGVAFGAGAALLMAPQSGEETRRQLSRGARRLYRRSGAAVSDWWDGADEAARRLSRRGLKRGRKRIAALRERARDATGW